MPFSTYSVLTYRPLSKNEYAGKFASLIIRTQNAKNMGNCFRRSIPSTQLSQTSIEDSNWDSTWDVEEDCDKEVQQEATDQEVEGFSLMGKINHVRV